MLACRRQIEFGKHLKNLQFEIGILFFFASEEVSKVVHLNIPMELEYSIQSSDTFHCINIQYSRFRDKDRCSVFRLSGIQLRVLFKVKTDFTSQSIYRVCIVVIFPRALVAFCSFFYHFNGIFQNKFARTKPATESPSFSFNFPEGVNCLSHLIAMFSNRILKLKLTSSSTRKFEG